MWRVGRLWRATAEAALTAPPAPPLRHCWSCWSAFPADTTTVEALSSQNWLPCGKTTPCQDPNACCGIWVSLRQEGACLTELPTS